MVKCGYQLDCDFPGGNVVVQAIDDAEVRLHPDYRDTEGFWFYWHFRVRGAAGRKLRFRFTSERRTIGLRGPAVSVDRGATWAWLSAGQFTNHEFGYDFAADEHEVRFSVGIPYLESNLAQFLARHEDAAARGWLRADDLCVSEKRRRVERLHLGRLDGGAEHRVLILARHHACEAMASYVVEGTMAAMLADTPTGQWLRERVECVVVPFMDKDGVEEGDQGKRRRPHDHQVDYGPQSLYASVRALRQWAASWSQGLLRCVLDMHCPGLHNPTAGGRNHTIFIMRSMIEPIWQQQHAFTRILANNIRGALPFDPADSLPQGVGQENRAKVPVSGAACANWASELPGVQLVATMEIPYAEARGMVMTADHARAFGGDLAEALAIYLRNHRAP
jgi:hypothetical protein